MKYANLGSTGILSEQDVDDLESLYEPHAVLGHA